MRKCAPLLILTLVELYVCSADPTLCPPERKIFKGKGYAKTCTADADCPPEKRCCPRKVGKICLRPITQRQEVNANKTEETAEQSAVTRIDTTKSAEEMSSAHVKTYCPDGSNFLKHCYVKSCPDGYYCYFGICCSHKKQGVCPMLFAERKPHGPLCDNDIECPNIMKCCQLAQGSYCVYPKDFIGSTVTVTEQETTAVSKGKPTNHYKKSPLDETGGQSSFPFTATASSLSNGFQGQVNFPIGPMGPGQPHFPGNPMGPGQPHFPGNTMGPGQPVFPGNPMGPGQPHFPGNPMGPGQPHFPGNPMGPGQPVFPGGTMGPVQPVFPGGTMGPMHPYFPGASIGPGQPYFPGGLPQFPGQSVGQPFGQGTQSPIRNQHLLPTYLPPTTFYGTPYYNSYVFEPVNPYMFYDFNNPSATLNPPPMGGFPITGGAPIGSATALDTLSMWHGGKLVEDSSSKKKNEASV